PGPRLLGRVLVGVLELLEKLKGLLQAGSARRQDIGVLGRGLFAELRGHEAELLLTGAHRLVSLNQLARRSLLLPLQRSQFGGQARAASEEQDESRDEEDDQGESGCAQ